MIIAVIDAYCVNHSIFKNSTTNELILLQDPFFRKMQEVKTNLSLQAIVSNKVKINNAWYVLNDEVEGYKIVAINKFQVILIKNQEEMVLNLYEKNNNIIIY
ncbi:hypothetical protein [Campylobacter insulaenigrae]|uniref:hypothetical protein n=1 Tax=Campylobacter insulaenigrae TaxID=260714 RepID=UPI000F825107|nr:hypothetical protein [Campylobacter insulaenigrae]MCR6590791.1 hypothetical protein [Campylobacter insulaenigrae]MCR6592468.1 hypothetical protein [Campylobacter insulaenigrae]